MAAAHLQPGLSRLERHYRAVSYATGVRKVVEFGSGPVELDATMIDAIKERLNNGYVPDARCSCAYQGVRCGVEPIRAR